MPACLSLPTLGGGRAKTNRIAIGTAVDMRYENPLYMAEDAGAADHIAGGRLQFGISRGSHGAAIKTGPHSPDAAQRANLSTRRIRLIRTEVVHT
jgi:alkanesulfonate monooxygenase SsuD/methylene tetrahydromethanopterin reductase-like flavin-dependent oxidoreductase (luciferase family)